MSGEKKNLIELAPYQSSAQGNAEAIAVLEAILDRAQKGEVVGVAIAYALRDRSGGHVVSHCPHGLALLGVVQILQQRMVMNIGWGIDAAEIISGDDGAG